jgi:hypothetical protein
VGTTLEDISMKLEEILTLLNLTKEEAADGIMTLDDLVKSTNRLIQENGLDWVKQNNELLRDQWMYVQTL